MVKRGNVWLITIIGVLLGVGFAYLAISQTDIQSVGNALSQARIEWMLAIFVLMYLQFLTKSKRWVTIMRMSRPIATKGILAITILGYVCNLILPHIGELSRSYFVKQYSNYPATDALFSIIIERMMDFFAVLVVFGICLAYFGEPTPIFLQASLFLGSAALVILIGIFLIVYRTETIVRLLAPLARRLHSEAIEKLREALKSAETMAKSMRHIGYMTRLSLYSLTYWILTLLTIQASFLALGMSVPLAVSGIILGTLVAGLILPAAPGQLGTTQLSFVIGAAVLSQPMSDALAASVLYSCVTLSSSFSLAVWAYLATFKRDLARSKSEPAGAFSRDRR